MKDPWVLLEKALNGLKWWGETYPGGRSPVDDEFREEVQKAIDGKEVTDWRRLAIHWFKRWRDLEPVLSEYGWGWIWRERLKQEHEKNKILNSRLLTAGISVAKLNRQNTKLLTALLHQKPMSRNFGRERFEEEKCWCGDVDDHSDSCLMAQEAVNFAGG